MLNQSEGTGTYDFILEVFMKKSIFTMIFILGLFSFTALAQPNTNSLIPFFTDPQSVVAHTDNPDTTFGVFTEITPPDSLFVTPPEEDFWVISTAPADYDNDGDLDIAVLGYYVLYNIGAEDKLVLMRNEGPAGPDQWDFTYINLPLGGMSTGASDMAWGDYDGDGDLDLVVGTDGNTAIYRNDTGSLVMTGIELPGYWEDNDQAYFDLRSITWTDYDNDGDPDLLIPSVPDFSSFTYRTALMRNDGTDSAGGWIFTEVDSAFSETMHAQSSWADFDGDGDLDLLLVNIAPVYDDGFIRRYRNDSNGVFVGEDILGSLTIEHGEAQWGDYDGDGDLDILVAGNVKELNGSLTPMALRIYRNDNESYIPLEVISDPSGEGWFDFTAATWADYDSDGDMDILLAGHYNSGTQIEGRARIYTNNNGVFTDSGNELPAPHAAGTHGGTFSWLDIDGDGDLDYLIAGEYFVPMGNGLVEAQMHLYRNDAPGQNEAPLIPTGLSFTQVSDNTALLSWDPGTDDHTPANALTYELKLFRDNVPVTVPAHTPEPGNVSTVKEWLVTGLESGNYTWTLSTIDAAYIASQVATGEFGLFPVSVNDVTGDPAGGYSLGQNYPNPFAHLTTIRYSVPQEGVVSLKVYNGQGKEVAILAGGKKQAGDHIMTFDATGLTPGIYYYRLQVNDFSQSRKMMILKGNYSE
jgi:hypothetical protein